jgi:DNA-3-methyladenine glycosylase I
LLIPVSYATARKSKPWSLMLRLFSRSSKSSGRSTALWAFVDGRPILNAPRSLKDLPAETALSRALSKDLVKRGFRFVGPKICYAFMQSVGLVNDHIIGCFRRDLNERSGTN